MRAAEKGPVEDEAAGSLEEVTVRLVPGQVDDLADGSVAGVPVGRVLSIGGEEAVKRLRLRRGRLAAPARNFVGCLPKSA